MREVSLSGRPGKRPGASLGNWRRALLLSGALAALGAVSDRYAGFLNRPALLASIAYAALLLFLGVAARGCSGERRHPFQALLAALLLTAGYIYALRACADPTPIFLRNELAAGDEMLDAGADLDAFLAYRDVYKRHPRSYPVVVRLGAAAYQMGDFDRARKYFAQAVDLAPETARWRALRDLGQAHWKLGEAAEAIRIYLLAGASGLPEAERPEWHYRLGWAYFDLKEYDAAIRHYDAVAGTSHRYAAASHYNIACALAQKTARAGSRAQRDALTLEAVKRLRKAWEAADAASRPELARGLHDADRLDPELAPLRGSPEFREFLARIDREG